MTQRIERYSTHNDIKKTPQSVKNYISIGESQNLSLIYAPIDAQEKGIISDGELFFIDGCPYLLGSPGHYRCMCTVRRLCPKGSIVLACRVTPACFSKRIKRTVQQ